MKICIIGAGAAGLCAAKRALEAGFSCLVFEQAGQVGGTWVYTDKVGNDEYGLPIHTSMYKNLRTNLPKEIMGFPDFPIKNANESYVTQECILSFLNNYTDHFKLRSHIQLSHHVKSVSPIGDKWEVKVTDLKLSNDKIETFDAVMVCNGHYNKPFICGINGSHRFTGLQMHSHDFRNDSAFNGKRVLVIGAGPSGMDIAFQISTKVDFVILSHHCKDIKTVFPDNFIQKPDVREITEHGIIFEDHSTLIVDIIIYATGYQYSFPFLNVDCGISVEKNYVSPLYKHLININRPTMCFVGLPFYVCAFSMFDLQARFFLKHLSGDLKLPHREDMIQDELDEMNNRRKEGLTKNKYHMMGPRQAKYYEDLSEIAKLEPIPPVFTNIHDDSSECFNNNLNTFRNDIYKIIDDHHFIRT